MKIPYGRLGGKRLLAKYILSLFPSSYSTYVEPFFGAGSVFFKIKDYHNHKEVINDLDPKITTVLKLLKNHSEYVDKHFNRHATKKYFDKIKNKTDGLSILESFKWSYAGNGQSYNENRKDIKTDYKPYGERLKNVIIKNESFEKVVKEYDSPTTLFYLDPPYEITLENMDKQYYEKTGITPEEVYNVCKNIKGMFILSYNYSPHIVKLFKEFDIKIVKVYYSLSETFKKEVVIKNF